MARVTKWIFPIILAHMFLFVPICSSQEESHKHPDEKFNFLVEQSRSDDTKEREKALLALAQTNDVRAMEYLIRALRDKDPDVENAAAGAIRRMGGLALKALLALLEEEDIEMRLKAAGLLAQIKDPLASERLDAALSDDDFAIVAGAYTYFAQSGQKGAEDALIQALYAHGSKEMHRYFMNCGSIRLREAACRWVAMHGDEPFCNHRVDANLSNR